MDYEKLKEHHEKCRETALDIGELLTSRELDTPDMVFSLAIVIAGIIDAVFKEEQKSIALGNFHELVRSFLDEDNNPQFTPIDTRPQ